MTPAALSEVGGCAVNLRVLVQTGKSVLRAELFLIPGSGFSSDLLTCIPISEPCFVLLFILQGQLFTSGLISSLSFAPASAESPVWGSHGGIFRSQ